MQYYINTKDTLPMDIEFITQDTFALTRPQWKIISNFEDAWRAFAELVTENYKNQEPDKSFEPETLDDDVSSEDDGDDDELIVPEMDNRSSSDDAETEVR